MMVHGRLVHLLPMMAAALLQACGGGDAAQPTSRTATPGVVVSEPHPQPQAALRDMELLALEPVSGVSTAQNVVIRTEAEFSALWTAHTRRYVPAPPQPKIDFSTQMVIGVFVGEVSHSCGYAKLHHVRDDGGRVRVSYETSTDHPEVCAQGMGAPAVLAAVPRSDAPVEFVAGSSAPVALSTVDHDGNSGVKTARAVVVKDQAAWLALWNEHAPRTTAPAVDFTRHMVIAAFMGEQPVACTGLTLSEALRAGNVITVRRTLMVPGPSTMCIQATNSPSHIVITDKSDNPVVFATHRVPF